MEPLNEQTHEFAVFNKACHVRGLDPAGFDVRSAANSAGTADILVKLGGKEYRYIGSDASWAEKFFIDIGDDGDSGDGVTMMTSEEERGEKHVAG